VKSSAPLQSATEAQLRTAAYYLSRDLMGYGLLDPYLRDPYIEDISCDGLGRSIRVWHSLRNEFDWLEGSLTFGTSESLDAIALRLANRSGAFVSAATPLVDATLPEGYRLSCTWRSEVSSFGSSFTVRKFRAKPFSITELIHMGTLSSDVAAFLWSLLELKGFVFIVGSSASGKTTILNSLASLMNPNWKVVTIEDVREINLQNPGWKALHTRTGALSGFGRVGLFELVRLSLRERPDYVILGEARGEETSVLFQSASTGHGCMATFHATDEDALWARLTQPPINIPLSLLGIIDAVVFVARTPGKSARTVLRVSEYQDGWRTIFKRVEDRYEGGCDFAIKFWRRGEASNLNQARQTMDIDEKRRFLEEQVRAQVFSYEELSVKLREYYSTRC
jgi:flagellar protein FlaI